MSDFVRVVGVPIFDESEGYSPSVLRTIAANSQARIDDSGDECPLVLGHTLKRGEKGKDPPIVGFADNFRVGRFGKIRPRACIFADFKIDKRHAQLVREQYPRRSIELWPDSKIIDPISLLGSRTPARDLGLLRFQQTQQGEPARFEFEADGFDRFMSQFAQSQIGVWIKSKMRQEQAKKTNDRIASEILADMQRSKVNRQLESAMKHGDIGAARAALESAHYARENEHGFLIQPMPVPRPVRPGGGGREMESELDLESVHRISRDRGISFAAALRDFKQG